MGHPAVEQKKWSSKEKLGQQVYRVGVEGSVQQNKLLGLGWGGEEDQ